MNIIQIWSNYVATTDRQSPEEHAYYIIGRGLSYKNPKSDEEILKRLRLAFTPTKYVYNGREAYDTLRNVNRKLMWSPKRLGIEDSLHEQIIEFCRRNYNNV